MGNSVGVRPDPGECPRFPLRNLVRVEKINSLSLKKGNNRLGKARLCVRRSARTWDCNRVRGGGTVTRTYQEPAMAIRSAG